MRTRSQARPSHRQSAPPVATAQTTVPSSAPTETCEKVETSGWVGTGSQACWFHRQTAPPVATPQSVVPSRPPAAI
ncbi:hypothetical protein OV079_02085 [Nannocystis pusilla]|uniref:Uncharacterized protein n=1 Tax=Nannocystis pusilla TaxID=889268 RepID=A0A9X3EJI5_9BACT|nr:hypothetical protein [Nannocystis pusilla]MCY1004374.1 hypothetical protein [Nannocystis pusilla]